MKKSIAINTLFNVTYKILNMLFPLVTSVYLARVLGPMYIGKVSYAQSILSYFTVLASLGIPTYGMREIAKSADEPQRRNKVFSELFLLNLLSTLVCSIIYTVLIMSISRFRADLKLFLCVGLSLYLNVFNIDWFYSGQEEYIYITLRSLIIKLLSLFLILFLVKNQEDYIVYAFILSVATTGNYVWNMINLRKRVHFQVHNLEFKTHLKSVIILLMTMLATDLYNQIDVTMLGLIRSDVEVGYYTSGVKIIKLINSITAAISATIIPRMCLFFDKKQEKDYKQLFWQTMDIVIIFSVPCFIGIILVSKPLILVMFGIEFLATVNVVRLLAPIILIISISYLVGSVVLTSTNNESCLLRATIVGSVVNVLLNSLLIPRFGIIGAAAASITGELVVLIIHFRYGWKYVRKHIDVRFIQGVTYACLIMIIVVVSLLSFIPYPVLSLLVSVVLGAFVYATVLIIFKNRIIIQILNRVKSKVLNCHHTSH